MQIAGHRIAGTGLGTAQFAFGPGTEQDAVATVHAALDAGVRLIDTALAYTRPGFESYAEQVVARALRSVASDRPLVVTKGGHWRQGNSFPVDGRPATLRSHCGAEQAFLRPSRRPAHRPGLRAPPGRPTLPTRHLAAPLDLTDRDRADLAS